MPNVIDRGRADHYRWGVGCDGWHLVRTPGLSVIEERVPPGGSETLHLHRHAHQFFYVLTGTATLELGGRTHELAPSQGLEVPPGVPHRLRNRGEADLVFLVISAPASHGDREAAEAPAGGPAARP